MLNEDHNEEALVVELEERELNHDDPSKDTVDSADDGDIDSENAVEAWQPLRRRPYQRHRR